MLQVSALTNEVSKTRKLSIGHALDCGQNFDTALAVITSRSRLFILADLGQTIGTIFSGLSTDHGFEMSHKRLTLFRQVILNFLLTHWCRNKTFFKFLTPRNRYLIIFTCEEIRSISQYFVLALSDFV